MWAGVLFAAVANWEETESKVSKWQIDQFESNLKLFIFCVYTHHGTHVEVRGQRARFASPSHEVCSESQTWVLRLGRRCKSSLLPSNHSRLLGTNRCVWEAGMRVEIQAKETCWIVFVLECHSSMRSSMLPHPPPHISQKVSQPNLFPLLCFEGGIWSIRKSGMSSSIAQAIKSCKVFDFPEHQLWTLDDRILFFTRLCGIKWDIVNTPHTAEKQTPGKSPFLGEDLGGQIILKSKVPMPSACWCVYPGSPDSSALQRECQGQDICIAK